MDCSICYDAITAATGKVDLSCSHTFHFSCLTTWFTAQQDKELSQSCPCCRHESNEHEKMPAAATADDESDEESDEESDDESDDDEYESMSEEEAIYLAAARERASMRFAKMKSEMTKEAFEAYAASKIAALYRGRCARYMVGDILEIRSCVRSRVAAAIQKREASRLMKNALSFNMKSLTMSHSAWRHHVASIIQKSWRAKVLADKKRNDSVLGLSAQCLVRTIVLEATA